MAILEAGEDKWDSKMYDLSCGLYFYFMNEQIFIHKTERRCNMPKSKERCQEIREEMRTTILQKSLLYFARNGFAGTKISDLSKNIGIGQGTIYVYFE